MTLIYGLTAEAVAKLQDTLDFITVNPERHNQATWLSAIPVENFETEVEPDRPGGCGTYGCVAGWLAMRNFGEIPESAWTPLYHYDHVAGRYTERIVGYDLDYSEFEVAVVARKTLGVEWGTQASYLLDSLFNGDRTLSEIWFVANQLADYRLRIPASVNPVDPHDEEYSVVDPCACGCEDDD